MEDDNLKYTISVGLEAAYLEVFESRVPLSSYQDSVDLIALCIENNTDRILIHQGVFSEQFFKLRSGIAGIFLQKFENYSIKAAMVVGYEETRGVSFAEMMSEMNRGKQIRFFEEIIPAREWLTAESDTPL